MPDTPKKKGINTLVSGKFPAQTGATSAETANAVDTNTMSTSSMAPNNELSAPNAGDADSLGAQFQQKSKPKGIDVNNLQQIANIYKPDNVDSDTWDIFYKSMFLGESGGDPDIGEAKYGNVPKGKRATGLVQIKPETAKAMGFSEEEIKNDPYANFAAGVKYLSENYKAIRNNPKVKDDNQAMMATAASYFTGLDRVMKNLDQDGDGIPDVDDGKITARDYVANVAQRMSPEMAKLIKRQSAQAVKVDEDYDVAQANTNAEAGITKPTEAQAQPMQQGVQRKTMTEDQLRGTQPERLVNDIDRGIREQLGLVAPQNYPNRIGGNTEVLIPFRRGTSVSVDTISDALADTLTGQQGTGERFRKATGENIANFEGDITEKWLQRQIESGAAQVVSDPNNPDLMFIKGTIPVQNYIKRRLDAFAQGGAQGVVEADTAMRREVAESERVYAEEQYGQAIQEARANAEQAKTPEEKAKFNAQAMELQQELDKRYPTSWYSGDELWRGIKKGLAGSVSNYGQLGLNVKNLFNAVLDTNDKEANARAKKIDEDRKRVKSALEAETPEVRTTLGNVADVLTGALTFDAPVYAAGGAILGPSGLLYTTALRSADKDFDEFTSDIAAALIELPIGAAGKALGRAVISGEKLEKAVEGGIKGKIGSADYWKGKLIEMGFGGLGEVGGDATVDLLQGKAFDAKKAFLNFVAGAAFEATNTPEVEGKGSKGIQTLELRSPIGVTIGQDGNARYQGMVKIGDKIGLVDLKPNDPLVLKYTNEVAKGNLKFLSMNPDEFDQALKDFKGDSPVIGAMTPDEVRAFLEKGEATATSETKQGEVSNDRENIGGQVRPQEQENGQAIEQTGLQESSSETGAASGVLQEDKQVQEGQEVVQSDSERRIDSQSGQSGRELLEEDKTEAPAMREGQQARSYNRKPVVFDDDLAARFDEARAKQRDISDRAANFAGGDTRVINGMKRRAGQEMTDTYRVLVEEQKKRDAEFKRQQKAKQTPTSTAQPSGRQAEQVESKPTEVIKPTEASKSEEKLDTMVKEIAEEQKKTPQTTTKPEDKSIAAGTKKVKYKGIEITLPNDLAQRYDQTNLDERAAITKLKGTVDQQVKQRRDISKAKKKAQEIIFSEYKAREEAQFEKGIIKSSGQPVKIVEKDSTTVTIEERDGNKRILNRSEVETQKEAAIKPRKGDIPTSIKTRMLFGQFKSKEPVTYATGGIIYMNEAANSLTLPLTDYSPTRGITIKASAVADFVTKLRGAGFNRFADQIEAQAKKTGNVALVDVTNELPGATRAHEGIHQVALGKMLTDARFEKLFKNDGAIHKLFKNIDKNKRVKNPLAGLAGEDIVQEIIAYGLTGDYYSLGADAEPLYDATLDVIQAYLEEFPEKTVDEIADLALVNYDQIRSEAKRRINEAKASEVQAAEQKRSQEQVQGSSGTSTFREQTKGEERPALSGKELKSKVDEFLRSAGGILKAVEPENITPEDIQKVQDAANLLQVNINNDPEVQGEPKNVTSPKKKVAVTQRALKKTEAVIEALRKPVEDWTPDDVKAFIEGGHFAVISGNKGEAVSSRGELKTKALKKELERMGYRVLEAEGTVSNYGEPSFTEPSLFVAAENDKDIGNILRLGRRYTQAEVFVGRGGTEFRSTETQRKLGVEKLITGDKGGILYGDDAEVETGGSTNVKLADGSELRFAVPEMNAKTQEQQKAEINYVNKLEKTYLKSFEARPKNTSADVIKFLDERFEKGERQEVSLIEGAKLLESMTAEMFEEQPSRDNMTKDEFDAARVRRSIKDGIAFIKHFRQGRSEQGSGQSWYADSVRQMHQKVGEAFPEIVSHPFMTLLFDFSLAISSQGNTPDVNLGYAIDIWRRLIEESKLGKGYIDGKVFPTMQKSGKNYGKFGGQFEKFNFMTEGYLPLDSKTKARLVKEGKMDQVVPTKEFAEINEATKFYYPDPEMKEYIEKYGKIGGVMEYLLQPGKSPTEPYRATEILGPKIGAFFLNIAGFSQLVTVDMWAARWFYRVNGGLVNETEKNGIQDAPKSKGDGDLIRGLMQSISTEWNENHETKLTPADVQAILWFAEKDMWFKAGIKDSGKVDFSMAADKKIPQVVMDIDGLQKDRKQVIDEFLANMPDMGSETKKYGTVENTVANKDFFTRQMAIPGRLGLAAASRKQTTNKKLLNFDSNEWNRQAERAKGSPLDATESNELYRLLGKGYQAQTQQEKDEAIDGLSEYLDGLSKQTLPEFFLTVKRAGLLSGIKTIGRNLLSNLAAGVLDEARRGTAGPLDLALSFAFNKPRTTQGISPLGILYAARKGFTKGLKASYDTFTKGSAGATYETFDLGYDPRSGYKWLDATVGNFAKYVFRAQAAGDAVFKTYAYHRALYEVAALTQKNTNGARTVSDVLTNPTIEESDIAWRTAEVMVFQNDNIINTGYQRFKSKRSGMVKFLLDYQVPFIKTGSNIFLMTMDYAAIGGIVKTAEALKDIKVAPNMNLWNRAKQTMWEAIQDDPTRQLMVEAFSRGLTGVGIATIGYALAKAGLLYGMDDEDEKERNKRIAEGAGPGHLKVNGQWHDIRQFAPVSTILLSGASAYRAETKELKDESKRYTGFINILQQMVLDGLPGARNFQEALETRSAAAVSQRVVGLDSLVPAIVGEIAQTMDKNPEGKRVQRETKADSFYQEQKNRIKAKIPGKRSTLPEREDVFGRAVEAPIGMNPFASKTAIDDPAVKEASKVGWSMTPEKRKTDKKTNKQEPIEKFRERKKKVSDLIKRAFDAALENPEYPKGADKEDRKEVLDTISKYARQQLRKDRTITDAILKESVDLILKKRAKIEDIEDEEDDERKEKRKKSRASRQYNRYIERESEEGENDQE